MFPPASVEMFIDSVSGIINLSSIDKGKIASILHLEAITNSDIYQRLDGVALSAIGILLIILGIGLAVLVLRNSPKAYEFVMKIK